MLNNLPNPSGLGATVPSQLSNITLNINKTPKKVQIDVIDEAPLHQPSYLLQILLTWHQEAESVHTSDLLVDLVDQKMESYVLLSEVSYLKNDLMRGWLGFLTLKRVERLC